MNGLEEVSIGEHFCWSNVEVEIMPMSGSIDRYFWFLILFAYQLLLMIRIIKFILLSIIQYLIRFMIWLGPSQHVFKTIFCPPFLNNQ